jgi:glucuronoarabinoxylan endo-1,4-beta-xylanase
MKLSKPFFAALLLLLLYAPHTQAQTATINWTTTYQTIDGFGVSDHGNGQPALSPAQSTFLFSPTSGIGLSILRTGASEDGSCTSISSACAAGTDPISDKQAAIANGARIIVSSWSPPASMKTNGSLDCTAGSGNGALISGDYGAFATYLSNYIASLKTYYSIPVFALSPQNEPTNCQAYSSALWTAANFDTFIKTNLGPTLAAAGQGSTIIEMPETSSIGSTFGTYTGIAGTCMADSACAVYVGANVYHAYDYYNSGYVINNPYSSPNRRFWQTEVSDGPTYGYETCTGYTWCPGISDALVWAYLIHLNMTAGANAWLWWNTQQSCTGTPWSCNGGLYGSDNATIATRAYAIGNWSKFVRPGWTRIDATTNPQSGVYVTAFNQTSNGSFAIVAANYNTADTSVTFNFTNFPDSVSTVTPWITSASLSLAQQSAATVSNRSFTYVLPASSITTFVGSTTTASVPPAPPTILTATVK